MSELSQEARALIDCVSSLDDPSDDDRTRIRKRLAMQLGASAFAATAITNVTGVTEKTVAATGKVGLFGMAGKAALCAGVLCATGSVWLLDWRGNQTTSSQPPAHVNSQQQAPAVLAPSVAESPTELALPQPALEPAADQAPNESARRVRTKPAREPRAVAPSSTPGSLAAELSLLRRAQAALRADQAGQALSLALEHASTFPNGVMREERLGVAALAECALSSSGAAASSRRHVQAFLHVAPSSPLAARVRRACGFE